MKRRHFIQQLSSGAILLGTGAFPTSAFASEHSEIVKLTILHTNDVHSRIDPFPMDGTANQGLGGAARRAALVKKIRAEEKNILLLDAGDIFQGTPYFNFYHGELEMKLMTEMGYDAATIGNHDFDGGLDELAGQLKYAKFSLLVSNYDFSNTVMKDKTKPYKIFEKQGVRIGIFGLGVKLQGLVLEKLYGETKYLDPVEIANGMARQLKVEKKCPLPAMVILGLPFYWYPQQLQTTWSMNVFN